MKNKNNNWVLLGITAVLLILVNLISLQSFFRIDLTRDKKFTLAKASIDTVRGLKDTLTVSAYFSEDLPPPYAQHARYVHDLLQEYEASSMGSFAYEFTDPAQAETAEDKAKKNEIKRNIFGNIIRESTSVENELSELGVEPVEIRVIEGDEQQVKRAFMGLVIRYQDKHEVIPVVQNIADLEKDLTSLMLKLTRTKIPKVGLVKDVGINIEKLSQILKDSIVLEPVMLIEDQEFAEDLDALLIVGSTKSLGPDSTKKLEAFIKKGKSVAFLLDRFSVDPATFELKPEGFKDPVFGLLASLGIEIAPSLVADTSCVSLNIEENNQRSFSLPVKYPFVPELMSLSFKSPISKGLSGVILPFISPIFVSKTKLRTEVLAQSSKISWQELTPNINPRRSWADKIEPDGPYNLIIEARDSSLNNRLVIAGSSAFIWDEFILEPNLILAQNIVDWLVADSSLLLMRTREFADAPLDPKLSDVTKKAFKYGNIFGVPLLLIFFGLLKWRMRERHRRFIKKMSQKRQYE